MPVSDSDIETVRELFSDLSSQHGPLTIRRMFGGTGIYCDGQIFAVQRSDGVVFLKAKGAFRDELAAAGGAPFEMVMNGTLRTMGYMSLPTQALDDPEAACEWARKALAAQQVGTG